MIRHIILTARPSGVPTPETFAIGEGPRPQIGPGEMLVKPRVFSMDPAIRGFLDDRPSYLPPVEVGKPVNGMSLGEVIESNNPAYPVGAFVRALGTWSELCVFGADAMGLDQVHPAPGVELGHYMGALGPVGLTAWIGLLHVGKAVAGETVLVSAAAGATGSAVGQIAKLKGCHVIGLVSSDEKAATIRDLGYDVAINYRDLPNLAAAIRAAAPNGIDVFFDNVGGETLETVLPLMATHGRVAVCGMIGEYNDQDHPYGVKSLWQLVVNRVTMQGFLTYDYPEMLGEAQAELDGWVASGALKPLTNIRHGFERIPEAFIDLMSGRTTGKTLVTI
jgi:NADPH-dependent curcumin reductase CurA